MRIVFIGGSRLAMNTARLLLVRGHDVVIIEREKVKVDLLISSLGCGVISGDGSIPAILREADPAACDFLFCVTDNDQTNIIASLIGRSLGFRHVVTRIDDPEFEHICIELGLENTIIPSRAISRYLAAITQGEIALSISAVIKNDAALFSFVVSEQDEMFAKELQLPENCQLICLYRGEKFMLIDEDTKLKANDEAVVLCHRDKLDELRKRWIHVDLGKDDIVEHSEASN